MFTNTGKNTNSIPNIILSVIIVATIPLAIYSLVNTNLDMRKQASSPEEKFCTIYLPYVNNKTLAVENEYQLFTYAEIERENIETLEIRDRFGNEILSEKYDSSTQAVLEKFSYTPTRTGEEILQGFVKTNRNTYPCQLNTDALLVSQENDKPVFLTNPYISAQSPSNTIAIGEDYKYTLEATDKDGDHINYYHTIEPESKWLYTDVVQNGNYGNLEIQFTGRPNKAGTHLINVFIHDGYKKHISVQTWQINVQEEVDENIEISKPEELILPLVESEYENIIKLPKPTIVNIKPLKDTVETKRNPTISAVLLASNDAEIIQDSISFTLNTNDISPRTLQISPSEYMLEYQPGNQLQQGEHQVKISFKDTNGLEHQKDWTFTIEAEDDETIIFGLPLSTIIIIIAGFILILFSLSIPWILYIAWKRNEEPEYRETPLAKKD